MTQHEPLHDFDAQQAREDSCAIPVCFQSPYTDIDAWAADANAADPLPEPPEWAAERAALAAQRERLRDLLTWLNQFDAEAEL